MLLYDSDTWLLTESDIFLIAIFEKRILRRFYEPIHEMEKVKLGISIISAGLSTTSALGEISMAPPNYNSNPYQKGRGYNEITIY